MEFGGDSGPHPGEELGGDPSGAFKSRLYSYGVQKPNALLNRPGGLKSRPPADSASRVDLGASLPNALLAKPAGGGVGRSAGTSGSAGLSRSFSENMSSFSAARPASFGASAALASLSESPGGAGGGGAPPPIPVAQLRRKAEAAEAAKLRVVEEFNTRRAEEAARSKRKGAIGGRAADVAISSKDAAAAAVGADKGAVRRNDPFWFIQMLRTELSNNEFAYMNVADSEGTSFDPYNLRIVPFNEVNPNNHYTISEAGVTHSFRKGKHEFAEFTPLTQWENECHLFQEVMEIPFFKRCARAARSGAQTERAQASERAARAVRALTSLPRVVPVPRPPARSLPSRSVRARPLARAGTTRGSRTTSGARTCTPTR